MKHLVHVFATISCIPFGHISIRTGHKDAPKNNDPIVATAPVFHMERSGLPIGHCID